MILFFNKSHIYMALKLDRIFSRTVLVEHTKRVRLIEFIEYHFKWPMNNYSPLS